MNIDDSIAYFSSYCQKQLDEMKETFLYQLTSDNPKYDHQKVSNFLKIILLIKKSLPGWEHDCRQSTKIR